MLQTCKKQPRGICLFEQRNRKAEESFLFLLEKKNVRKFFVNMDLVLS